MKRSAIKIKAMGLFVADGRVLATPGYDSPGQLSYFRLLGGNVEFGERSDQTLAREMLEELAAEVEVLELLEVVQDVFDFEGKPCHEIAFVHNARFVDEAFHRRETLTNIEPHNGEVSRWIPIAEALYGPLPLFPAANYRRWLT